MFNALQPGVFALSGWDLCGMLTLPRQRIPALLSSGDVRWLHRAAYDLMNYRPEARESPSRIPRGTSLYGSLPEQLRDADSFASRLARVLQVRARHRIATSVQLDVPPADDEAMLVMVHLLDTGRMQATVLNFADRTVTGRVISGPPARQRRSDGHVHRQAHQQDRPGPRLHRVASGTSGHVAADRFASVPVRAGRSVTGPHARLLAHHRDDLDGRHGRGLPAGCVMLPGRRCSAQVPSRVSRRFHPGRLLPRFGNRPGAAVLASRPHSSPGDVR